VCVSQQGERGVQKHDKSFWENNMLKPFLKKLKEGGLLFPVIFPCSLDFFNRIFELLNKENTLNKNEI
jgi:hypothetical protein